MKIPALLAFVFLLGPWATAETVTVPVAKAVSSIPLLALEGQSVGGLTLATPLFDDHPLALAELLGGRSQVLLTGSTLALKNHLSGGPLVQVATPVWDVAGLVTLDPGVKSLADLAGKSLVVPVAGGPLDLQVQAVLKAKGLAGKVTIDYAEPPQAAALLLHRQVAAAGLPEPLVSKLVIQNGAQEIASFSQLWAELNGGDGRAPQVSLVARKDWAAAHGPFLQALVTSLSRSIDRVKADPKAYAAKFGPVLGLPAAVVERGLTKTLFNLPSAAETEQLYLNYLKLTGESRLPAKAYFQVSP